jgi:hypothetical protein
VEPVKTRLNADPLTVTRASNPDGNPETVTARPPVMSEYVNVTRFGVSDARIETLCEIGVAE